MPYDLETTLIFLSDLSINNNRPWFEKHKQVFDKAKAAFEGLVGELIDRLSGYEDLSGVTPQGSIMRIYRDIRFSRDKTPYNPWMAAHIAPGGKKSGRLGLGLRLGPGVSGVAGGLWAPSPEQLSRFRKAVDNDAARLLDIVHAPAFVDRFGDLQGDRLVTAPKGYAKDHPAADLLKLKQAYVVRSLSNESVLADNFVDELVTDYLVMKPFLDYLNEAIVR